MKLEGQWLKRGVSSYLHGGSWHTSKNIPPTECENMQPVPKTSLYRWVNWSFVGLSNWLKGLFWPAGKEYLWGGNKASHLYLFSHLPFPGWNKSLSPKQTSKKTVESLKELCFYHQFLFCKRTANCVNVAKLKWNICSQRAQTLSRLL